MRRSRRWQRVIAAQRVILKGYGWWRIDLACGHSFTVLHGPESPLGSDCQCAYGCLTDEAQPGGNA